MSNLMTAPFKDQHDIRVELSESYDTLFTSGYSVHYTLDTSNTIHIKWGDASFSRSKEDEMYPGWAPSEVEHEWTYHIGLHHSCGSPCWSHTLLPKNLVDSMYSYNYPLLCHPEKDILFYREYLNLNYFILENINSQEKIKIYPDHFPEFGFFLDGLDTFYFEKDEFVLTWRTELSFDDGAANKTKRFPLDAIYQKWETTSAYEVLDIPVIAADSEYFEKRVMLTLKSHKAPFNGTHFSALYSTYAGPVKVELLKWPGINDVVEVVRVEFVFSTCGSETHQYYFLVDKEGVFTELPSINYKQNDNPDPYQAYVFPNEKYGQRGKILLIGFTPEYGSTAIEKAKVLKEVQFMERG